MHTREIRKLKLSFKTGSKFSKDFLHRPEKCYTHSFLVLSPYIFIIKVYSNVCVSYINFIYFIFKAVVFN